MKITWNKKFKEFRGLTLDGLTFLKMCFPYLRVYAEIKRLETLYSKMCKVPSTLPKNIDDWISEQLLAREREISGNIEPVFYDGYGEKIDVKTKTERGGTRDS